MTVNLFSSFQLGSIGLPNRMVMAPMTRTRASEAGVIKPIAAKYYSERASAGLIITECTRVSEEAHGIYCAPGIYTAEHIAAWRAVTDAVHAAGGRIFLQLWHAGRTGHSSIRGGELPLAPSAIAAEGKAKTPQGPKDYEVPRALETGDIPRVVEDFRAGAKNALEAGFDGVELHGAFGYLVDEFLQDSSNQRTDRYGGSPANRCRFALEIIQAMVDVWGAERVGIKISPSTRVNGMIDSDPLATFGHLVRELDRIGIAYVHMMEPNEADLKTGTVKIQEPTKTFRPMFERAVISNVGYTKESANAVIAAGTADLVSFGKLFLANPDLPYRFAQSAPLNSWDFTTFYGADEKGYTDYPALAGKPA